MSAHRLRQYLMKASFASEGDRYSAMECLRELEQGEKATEAKTDSAIRACAEVMDGGLRADHEGVVDAFEYVDSGTMLYTEAAINKAIAQERERCARICDQLDAMSLDPMVCRGSAEECAEAIRQGGAIP